MLSRLRWSGRTMLSSSPGWSSRSCRTASPPSRHPGAGLAVPGRRLGTWRSRGRTRLVDVRRGQPALRVQLSGQRYDELLVGSDDAQELAGRLQG